MLHAAELGFVHPATEREVRWERPTPEDMLAVIARLKRHALAARGGPSRPERRRHQREHARDRRRSRGRPCASIPTRPARGPVGRQRLRPSRSRAVEPGDVGHRQVRRADVERELRRHRRGALALADQLEDERVEGRVAEAVANCRRGMPTVNAAGLAGARSIATAQRPESPAAKRVREAAVHPIGEEPAEERAGDVDDASEQLRRPR